MRQSLSVRLYLSFGHSIVTVRLRTLSLVVPRFKSASARNWMGKGFIEQFGRILWRCRFGKTICELSLPDRRGNRHNLFARILGNTGQITDDIRLLFTPAPAILDDAARNLLHRDNAVFDNASRRRFADDRRCGHVLHMVHILRSIPSVGRGR